MVNSHGSKFFLKKTIYEYLWEYREPVLDTSKNIVPGLVPVNNMGMLARVSKNFAFVIKKIKRLGHKRERPHT